MNRGSKNLIIIIIVPLFGNTFTFTVTFGLIRISMYNFKDIKEHKILKKVDNQMYCMKFIATSGKFHEVGKVGQDVSD